MPTLDWIGKKAVLNHDRKVPFHLLKCDRELSVGDPGSGNLLVEGDNLLALKALLPYYAGQVKCIYIDPPYNTGNEGWVYNDAVNSPEMRAWLGQTSAEQAIRFSVLDRRITQGTRGPARRRRFESIRTLAATCAQRTSSWKAACRCHSRTSQ